MRVYNYAAYAKVFEKGVPNPNMTVIAKVLFEPIISMDGVVNRVGNPYVITPTYAKNWYEQHTDIPENIKRASGRPELVNSIADYFSDKIIDVVINQMLESVVYSAMLTLIRDSDLEDDQKQELLDYYTENERAEFLGKAFLYSVVRDNLKKDSDIADAPAAKEIQTFHSIVDKSRKKPKRIEPPAEIEDHEMGYVRELYRTYHQVTGDEYARPEDLDGTPKLRRDFDRQRKDYYLAETIHRELRDTIRQDETEGFDILKDEMYDGVITTRDKAYDNAFERLTAVMEHATKVPISHNLQEVMLDWVGPGEKKGVCHMLVNDERLTWVEEEDGNGKPVI